MNDRAPSDHEHGDGERHEGAYDLPERPSLEQLERRAADEYEAQWDAVTRDFRVTTTALVRFATSPLRHGIVPLSMALPGRFGAIVDALSR